MVVSEIDATGTLLATGGADGIVKIWDIRGGFVTHTFHGHSGVISALHFFEVESPPSKDDASSRKRKRSSRNGDETKSEMESFENEGTIGYRLASGGEDGKVRIWNLDKRTSAATLDSHVSVVRSLAFSPQENALVSASRDKTLILWDAKSWKQRATIPVLEGIEAAGFLLNGRYIYCGGESGQLRIWTTNKPREVTQEQQAGTENDMIQAVIYHETLPFLITVHADQTLVLRGTAPLESIADTDTIPHLPVIRRIYGTHDQIVDVAYVGEDKSLLALATNSEDIRIISLKSAAQTKERNEDTNNFFGSDIALLRGHSDFIVCMDIDWSGHWLVTGAKDNAIRLWRLDPSANQFTCYAIFTGHAESVGGVGLPRMAPPKGSAANTHPLDHPPAFLVSGSSDQTVKKWDTKVESNAAETRKATKAAFTRKAHTKDINAVVVNFNNQLFASASQDKTVKVFSVEDGSAVGVLSGHKRGVWTAAFSPQDTSLNIAGTSGSGRGRGYILTGSSDKTVKLWSLVDFSCLITMEGHTNSVLKVVWLSSNQDAEKAENTQPLVGSAGSDGLVKVWEAQSGECAATLDNHTDRVWALATRPSTAPAGAAGERLVSAAADGVVSFWKDTTVEMAQVSRAKENERIELDQQLMNHVHHGNFREAIVLALQLDQPGRLLSLFKSVAEAEDFERGSRTGKREVDQVIADLADEQIYRLLLRCRDWNTNARNALVAQRVLRAVVGAFDMDRLSSLRIGRTAKGASLAEVLEGLRVYGERHFNRTMELWDESFVLEFTLREMDEIAGTMAVKGVNGGTNGHYQDGDDVIMIE